MEALRSKAIYRQVELKEYRGNPLIEALPPIPTDLSAYQGAIIREPAEAEDRSAPPHIRRKMLSRLSRFRYPLPQYLDIYRAIEDALYEGYLYKNPLTPTGQHFLHYLDSGETSIQPGTGSFQPMGRGLSIFGESGAGKTAALESSLSLFPQVIEHSEYGGRPFNTEQVTWLKIECPSSATVWGYVTHVLDELDRVFGSTEFSSAPRPKNVEDAGNAIERRLRSLHLGLLILDELQNLKVGTAALRRQLLNVLLHLINRSGIPVVFSGNQDTKELLSETLRNARRADDGGCFDLGAIDPAIWPTFVEHLWSHQFTDTSTPLTDDLSRVLFKLSRGLPKFAVGIYREAQKNVIGTGDELLSTDVLTEAYLSGFGLSRRILESLPSQELPPVVISDDRGNEESRTAKSKEEEPEQSGQRDIPSANRIQHPEFRPRLLLTRQNGYSLPLNVDSDTLRVANNSADPYEYLLSRSLLFSDLLSTDSIGEISACL